MNHREYYTALMRRRDALSLANQQKFDAIFMRESKDVSRSFFLSLLFGWLALDRFYNGQFVVGAVKLMTTFSLGIGVILDWFLISGSTEKRNLDVAQRIMMVLDYPTAVKFLPDWQQSHFHINLPKGQKKYGDVAPLMQQSNMLAMGPDDLPIRPSAQQVHQDIILMRDQLKPIARQDFDRLYLANRKGEVTMLIISIFLGIFGIDRFMIGHRNRGFIKLVVMISVVINCWIVLYYGDPNISDAQKQVVAFSLIMLLASPLVYIWDWFAIVPHVRGYNLRKTLNIKYLVSRQVGLVTDEKIMAQDPNGLAV